MLIIKGGGNNQMGGCSCVGTKEGKGVKRRHDMKERSICKHSIRYVNI